MNKNVRRALIGVILGSTGYVALALASAWTFRQLDKAVIDSVTEDDDEETNDVTDDAGETRQLDPEVLRWMREQRCGCVLDVVTGVVRLEPQLPPGAVSLDLNGLEAEAETIAAAQREYALARERERRALGDRQPSSEPLPDTLRALADELSATVDDVRDALDHGPAADDMESDAPGDESRE